MSASHTGLIYRGPIYGGSGYADVSVGVLMALHDAGIPVQTIPMGDPEDHRKLLTHDTRAILEEMNRNRLDLSRSIFYQSCPGGDLDIQMRGRVQVAHSMFETDRLPLGWAERFRAMDEIFIPASYFAEVLDRAGVTEPKRRIVARGLDTDLYRPGAEPMAIPQTRGFNFLSVFDWHHRKGPDLLLRAYLSEFRADEDVALILKVYQINNSSLDLEAEIADFIECEMGLTLEGTPPIVLLNGFLPYSEMPRLYASADVFVLPTRGEGWGPFLEPMACGLPVIATRWSGMLDYLDDSNSFPIDLDGVEAVSPQNDVEIFAGHRWAAPSVDHLRRQMRAVFTDREETRCRGERGRQDVVNRYSWSVVGRRWAAEIARLLN